MVLSKLDYCNSLLIGTSEENKLKLQRLQNNAARLILKKRIRDHASPLLRSLHWLLVEKRLQYKAATICYGCVHGSAPQYLQDIVKTYVPTRQLRSSTDSTALVVLRMDFKRVGERSFGYCAPRLWNALPQGLREVGSIDAFKQQLKTYLFNSWFHQKLSSGSYVYNMFLVRTFFTHFLILLLSILHKYVFTPKHVKLRNRLLLQYLWNDVYYYTVYMFIIIIVKRTEPGIVLGSVL